MATKNINAEKIQGNLSITSVSATTYYNLPLDITITGGTYSASSSTIIFKNNTGGTFNVTGITATGGGSFTGGTVTGATIFTGGLSANTISATTYQNLPFWSAGSGSNSVVLKNSNSIATNTLALAEGSGTTASGYASHSEGWNTTANGTFSHAEGRNTLADFYASHAEGYNTTANYYYSHAEGWQTLASGTSSHAEGYQTTASQLYSHAEGEITRAEGQASHAEGNYTIAIGIYSHAEGTNTTASGYASHAEGISTTANVGAHSEGWNTNAYGTGSHTEGYNTTATGQYSHAEGSSLIIYPSPTVGLADPVTNIEFDFGNYTVVSIDASQCYLQGDMTGDVPTIPYTVTFFKITSYVGSVNVNLNYYQAPIINYVSYDINTDTTYVLFGNTLASEYVPVDISNLNSIGNYSHAEGFGTSSTGLASHAEGAVTNSIGYYSHAEGSGTTANGIGSHSEGYKTIANGIYSHAEGSGTTANGIGSHSEGYETIANGDSSHAGGSATTANGLYSFVHGYNSIANGNGTIVLGNNLNGSNDNTVYVNALTGATIGATNYINLPYFVSGSSGTYSLKVRNDKLNDSTGDYAFSINASTRAEGIASFALGSGTTAQENASFAGGINSLAYGKGAFVFGTNSSAFADGTIVLGTGQYGNIPDMTYSQKMSVSGSGTSYPIFNVKGSNGSLFTVYDSITGTLFSVNNISGLPVFEVLDNDSIKIGYQSVSQYSTKKVSLTAGTNTIYLIPTSAYTSSFFEYSLSGSSGMRAGNVMSIWSGSTAQYTETSTNDIGNTSNVTFSVDIVGSNARFIATSINSGWTVSTIIKSI